MAAWRFVGFLSCIWIHQVTYIDADPCTSYSHLPRAEYRGGQCPFVQNKEVCDRTLSSTTWYRAVGLNGDLTMQTSPAEFMMCGTQFPVWMNGTHPSLADGEVERSACQTGIASYCFKSLTIRVKNCDGFFVYQMPSLTGCPEAYCFGENDDCPPFNPCDFYENSAISYDASRSTSCIVPSVSTCDSFDSTTWYRFRGVTGHLSLASTCPASTCGAQSPLWITSTGIQHTNGTKTSTVCVKSGSNFCAQSFTIESKECSAYTVYRLNQGGTSQCQRYCTDDSSAVCPTTTSSTTTQKLATTTVNPNSSNGPNTVSTQQENKPDVSYAWMSGIVVAGTVVGAITGIIATYFIMQKRMRSMVGDSQLLTSHRVPQHTVPYVHEKH